jgi:hypothetical protein
MPDEKRWIPDVLTTMDYGMQKIRKGEAFYYDFALADIGAATGDHITISFTTPAATIATIYMTWEIHCEGEVAFTVREAATSGVGGGGASTPYNRDRNSAATTSLVGLKSATTVGAGGIVLVEQWVGVASTWSYIKEPMEWALKAETLYSFRMYTTANTAGSIALSWVEV